MTIFNSNIKPPPQLSSGYLDIKDIKICNVLKIGMGVKFHITSYRVWVPWASKSSPICREDWNGPGAQMQCDMTWNFTPIFIFSTLHIFYVKIATSEGGCLHILEWETTCFLCPTPFFHTLNFFKRNFN